MDLRGHGDNDATFDSYDSRAASTDAIALAEELGAGEVDLIERLSAASVGRSRGRAVHALFGAYRGYAHEHPGRYTALQRAPRLEEPDAQAEFARPVEVIASVLRGFDIPEERMVHTIRALRSALHGFIDLETHGGFGMPESVDESYTLLVEGFVRVLEQWPDRGED